jgi:hypothetical protein
MLRLTLQNMPPDGVPCPAVTAKSLRDGFWHAIKATYLFGAKKEPPRKAAQVITGRGVKQSGQEPLVSTEWTINVMDENLSGS